MPTFDGYRVWIETVEDGRELEEFGLEEEVADDETPLRICYIASQVGKV